MHESKDRLELYRLRKVPPQKVAPGGYASRIPEIQNGHVLVSHFDEGNQNHLGGYFNVYQRHPSSASCGLEPDLEGRQALTLVYQRAATGFCGMWVHFFDLKQDPDNQFYLNSKPFSEVTFWIRGASGGERVYLKVSDAEWNRKEDALFVGEISDFIESGRIDTSWQMARIPLTALPDGIRREELAGLVFDIPVEDDGSIQIGTLAFVTEKGQPPPRPPIRTVSGRQKAKGRKQEQLATWVWETTRIMGSRSDQAELMDFLTRQKINHLFLQLPNEPDKLTPDGGVGIDVSRMRPFLAMFNRKGIKVHALDGWKMFALPAYHDTVLSTIRNVIRYNRESAPSERFYGFHYDIEPYLLPGFGGALARRDWILENYLTIIKKSRDLAHEAGMVYGCDIPFWFDSPDDFTNELFVVEFAGKRKFVSEHVIDLMDNVGIMDYRTVAYGADGILAHSSGEIGYASRTSKPIFVGLETFALPDETLWMFRTAPQRGFPLLAEGQFLFAVPRTDTVASFYFVPGERLEEFTARMKGIPDDRLSYWRLRENIFVPSSKITFAGMDSGRFKKAADQTVFELTRHPEFYGLAIHYYETWRDLLKR